MDDRILSVLAGIAANCVHSPFGIRAEVVDSDDPTADAFIDFVDSGERRHVVRVRVNGNILTPEVLDPHGAGAVDRGVPCPVTTLKGKRMLAAQLETMVERNGSEFRYSTETAARSREGDEAGRHMSFPNR